MHPPTHTHTHTEREREREKERERLYSLFSRFWHVLVFNKSNFHITEVVFTCILSNYDKSISAFTFHLLLVKIILVEYDRYSSEKSIMQN